MDKHNIKIRHKQTFEIVRAILVKEDWLGVMSAGCPEDEYDDEAVQIVAELTKSPDSNQLTTGIITIFESLLDTKVNDRRRFELLAADTLQQTKHLRP